MFFLEKTLHWIRFNPFIHAVGHGALLPSHSICIVMVKSLHTLVKNMYIIACFSSNHFCSSLFYDGTWNGMEHIILCYWSSVNVNNIPRTN